MTFFSGLIFRSSMGLMEFLLLANLLLVILGLFRVEVTFIIFIAGTGAIHA